MTQCHRATEKEEVRAQHHQHHSEEEHQQGTYGVCGADGEEIGNAQQEHAQYRRKPADFGRPFSRLFPTQQLHWLGLVQLDQVAQQHQQKENGKENGAHDDANDADGEAQGHGKVEELKEQHQHERSGAIWNQ